jgi:hypothetical protein
MSGRSAYLGAVVIVIVLAGAMGWGCGGGGQDTTTSSTAIVPSTVPSGGGSAGNSSDLLINHKLEPTSDTPSAYVDAVDQGRPVVILFYVDGSVDDAKVLDSVTRLQPAFADYVFLLYDYRSPSAYGDLSTLLKVSYPPELVLVDGTGIIRAIWNGYVDEGTLNQSLVNIGQG